MHCSLHFARVAVAFLAIAVICSPASLARAADFGSLNGTWEGALAGINGAGVSTAPADFGQMRIVIRDGIAQVFLKHNNDLEEVKPGDFQVVHYLTNAVVMSIDTGHDQDGQWVESWVFTVTQKDANTLLVQFCRQVNNLDMPANAKGSKFTIAAAGELRRITPSKP